jgi:hypothetical protein
MPYAAAPKELAIYLHNNKPVREMIRAQPGKTLLYAGTNFKACWKEIGEAKLTNPQVADKQILPEVLKQTAAPGSRYSNFMDWLSDIDLLHPQVDNGFMAWRLVSGLFAANAIGAVSFWLGSWDQGDRKIFAITELPVLRRNKNVDATTKELLDYYARCIEQKKPGDLVSFTAK